MPQDTVHTQRTTNRRLAAVPTILVLTADAQWGAIDRARRSGADIVLTKPTLIEDLLTAMRQWLSDADDHISHVHRAIAGGKDRSVPPSIIVSTPKGRTSSTKSFERFTTTTPSASPPSLTCPSCDRRLTYERSHVGGVSDRHPEQWDYYTCPASCGTFQYPHRTRTTRPVESGAPPQSGPTPHRSIPRSRSPPHPFPDLQPPIRQHPAPTKLPPHDT